MALTVKQVEKLIREAIPGAKADGAGLYLKITPEGNASWQYRYQIAGRRRAMGLGPCSLLSLAEARHKVVELRSNVKQGNDPLEEKAAKQKAALICQPTFKELAIEYIDNHRSSWRNVKHGHQWTNTLTTYAFPVIGEKLIGAITTADILEILNPIWEVRHETAARVRNRIELIIDAGRAQGYSTSPNPAVLRGHIDKLLPKRKKGDLNHHPAMDYRVLPGFFKQLRSNRSSLSSVALQLTILTATRTSEVLNATWEEFDLVNNLWIIPASRMKAGVEHRVPISTIVRKLLETLSIKENGYVFPGARVDRPLSNMSMLMVLRVWAKITSVYGTHALRGYRVEGRSSVPNRGAVQAVFPREAWEL